MPDLRDARASLAAGAALYNEGQFWDAHEAWEELWLAAKANDQPGLAGAVQGLILATAAYENVTRGKARGASTQMAKAVARLTEHGDELVSLGVTGLDGFVDALHRTLAGAPGSFEDGIAGLPTQPPPLTLR